MILFWHQQKKGEQSAALLERALLAYCDAMGKKHPRKKNRVTATGAHGKPYYPVLTSVFFSVTHTGDWWLCAFGNHSLGIDAELCAEGRHNFDALAKHKFRPEEQACYNGAADKTRGFLTLWTRKEAYLKYTGEGLSRDLKTVPVVDEEGRLLERVSGRYDTEGEAPLPAYVYYREVSVPEHPELVVTVCGPDETIQVEELPEEEPEKALEEAKEQALTFLESRPRTEQEVRAKLREKGTEQQIVEDVIAFLTEYGYVDDEAYAERFAEEGRAKGRGPLRMERELALKGVSRDRIRKALEGISFEEGALEVARKALKGDELNDKTAARILRRLASQGYSSHDAYEALAELRRECRE